MICHAVLCLVAQSCPTLRDLMDCQIPLSMGFPKQKYWSGLPFPPPGDLPNLEIEPRSPALQADSYCLSYQGSPYYMDPNQIKQLLKDFNCKLLKNHYLLLCLCSLPHPTFKISGHLEILGFQARKQKAFLSMA